MTDAKQVKRLSVRCHRAEEYRTTEQQGCKRTTATLQAIQFAAIREKDGRNART
ncbi:MAG: hypothetical protein ACRCUI_11810 [Polymorphobacter sp.]